MNPSHTYEANLAQFGLATLHKGRQELCDNQFERISTTSHKRSSTTKSLSQPPFS